MADFSVDYTETGTLRDNVASLRDQLASLQRIGTLTREEAGFAGIASMVEECDGTLTDCVTGGMIACIRTHRDPGWFVDIRTGMLSWVAEAIWIGP